MAKKVIQGCFAGCEMDCYYFGCVDREKCEQFKRFQKGERLNARGEVVDKMRGCENGR